MISKICKQKIMTETHSHFRHLVISPKQFDFFQQINIVNQASKKRLNFNTVETPPRHLNPPFNRIFFF